MPFEAVAAQRQGAGWYGEESFHAEARDHLAARDFSKTVFDVQGH
ncbi:hypothetical protein ACI2LC_07850 [Nonomuraea wenchangensis]